MNEKYQNKNKNNELPSKLPERLMKLGAAGFLLTAIFSGAEGALDHFKANELNQQALTYEQTDPALASDHHQEADKLHSNALREVGSAAGKVGLSIVFAGMAMSDKKKRIESSTEQ